VPVPQRIGFAVADVARATAFYESLGWRRAGASVKSTTYFEIDESALVRATLA
jgi:hypothetical protein